MAKLVKVLAVALVGVLAVASLAACGASTYGKIKSAFEKEGYTVEKVTTVEQEGVGKVTTYTVSKDKLPAGTITEFAAGKDIIKLVTSEEVPESVKGLYKDIVEAAEKAGLINGNCLFVPLTLDVKTVTDIFKNA